ncbi:RB-associated KRAB zinc finger protein-like [Ochlerotatus camptorhynchus]|uniref:RB-associated KRAB zinc finger protein-like n=1 Tax=Ochlerotatus camptorhynchus TaxID=644619 RepID=UPI0031D71B31
MTTTAPLLHPAGGSAASNECRMLLNVARYYDVISKLVNILDELVPPVVVAASLQVMHKPESQSILIYYGEPDWESKPDHLEVQKVEQDLVPEQLVHEEVVSVGEMIEELPEDVIIEEQGEEDLIYIEEEQLESGNIAEEGDEIHVEEIDFVKDEEQLVELVRSDQIELDPSQMGDESDASEYYVEYLQDDNEIDQGDASQTSEATDAECSDNVKKEQTTVKSNNVFLVRYKCQFLQCSKKFMFAKDYDEHLRRDHPGVVSAPILLQCKHIDCTVTFDDTYKLHVHHKKHKMSPSRKVSLTCSACQIKFSSKAALRRHAKEHPKDTLVKSIKQNFKRKCQFCDEILDPKINVYNIHCLEKHGHAPYNCFICGKEYFLLTHLSEHVKAGHNVESVQNFISQSLWRSFSIDDDDVMVNECRMCFRLFASPKAELQHQENHLKELSITCAICGGKHYESQCSEPRPKFTSVYEKVQCGQCQRWMSKKNIKEHMATHTSERNYPCTVCKKTFKVQRTAHRHIQNHINADNRLRKCYDCEEEYIDEDFLEQHYKQAHPDKQPFNCLICRQGFYRKALLGDHSHTHSDEERRRVSVKNPVEHYQIGNARVYECTLCRRSFSAKRTTVAHFIVHTDRPFVCEHCKMSFRVKTALEDHLLDVHKVKVE